ncbi:thiol:disulfide interchange protein DsbA/DsbL [Paucibacter sp. APW11]|uniref:Thiol:disulfide interchange protein n=1 Tax=Roseateles aquae TaxID=3077235 RepID=A0ABU3P7Z2_9BURK|nr:thiol:disulfide interchange protein DsbA/DsbL [Paucibacter sp. APW11]MDT8998687.1 thiol:disulfide interchange protein DsbA/DsbL [Paucibacter sp. APW11]
MKRRTFCTTSLTALGLGAMGTRSQAQTKPIEGKHYRRLAPPQPVSNDKGEVLEFFWYGCPACYRTEPSVKQWLARKPAQVSFKRSAQIIHTISRSHQRMFFTLDQLGLSDSLHTPVFDAVQKDSSALQELPEILALMGKLGVDTAKFGQVYQSFAVASRCRQADQMMSTYGLNSVPSFAVNGRYVTSPSMAGGEAACMAVVDYLLSLPTA